LPRRIAQAIVQAEYHFF
jgi:chromosome segregation ATPase